MLSSLRELLNLLSDRSHWTKNTFARDKWGHDVPTNSPKAARYCLLGAIDRKVHGPFRQDVIRLVEDTIISEYDVSMVTFNDMVAKHKDIVAVLNKAIQFESGEIEQGV